MSKRGELSLGVFVTLVVDNLYNGFDGLDGRLGKRVFNSGQLCFAGAGIGHTQPRALFRNAFFLALVARFHLVFDTLHLVVLVVFCA